MGNRDGISIDKGGNIVRRNIALDNESLGMFVFGGNIVEGNVAMRNGGDGIEIHCPSNVRGNTAVENDADNAGGHVDLRLVGASCNLDSNVAVTTSP